MLTTIKPVVYCRHWDVTWVDNHVCCCKECGKFGRWYEDGFVLWQRRQHKSDVA